MNTEKNTESVGFEFEARVRSLSGEGYGVVEGPSGRVFFAPGAWPEDMARFQVQSLKDRYGFAKLLKVIEPSPERRPSPCVHHGFAENSCGGCPWIGARYEAQLKYKEQRVLHALKRASFSNLEEVVEPIWASPDELAYRNRAQFKTDGLRLGFVAAESHEMVPIEKCVVLNEPMREIFGALKSQLPNANWKPEPPHKWNYIDVDVDSDPLNFPLNRRRPFRQANDRQNENMKNWVAEKLRDYLGTRKTGILELFCGSGNFTEVLLPYASTLWAVEASKVAVNELEQRLGAAVQGLCYDLFKHGPLRHMLKQLPRDGVEVLFLDPPRDGAKLLCESLTALPSLRAIVYVSCDTATLVRDLVILRKQGFTLKALRSVDLFPQTAHVENMAFLQRES